MDENKFWIGIWAVIFTFIAVITVPSIYYFHEEDMLRIEKGYVYDYTAPMLQRVPTAYKNAPVIPSKE